MKTFAINLDHRPERWEHVKAEARKMKIDVERVPAVYHEKKRGWFGCRDSHFKVLSKGWVHGTFCVLEDDALFLPGAKDIISKAMEQLPDDWDMLYLGASPQEPQERYSDNLFRLKNAKCTHAIVWNARPDGALEYVLDHREDITKIDVYYAEVIQVKFNTFTVDPIACTQSARFCSDIAKHSDVSTIFKNHNKYCK